MSHKSFVICNGPEGSNGKSALRRCISSTAPKFHSSLNKVLILKPRNGRDSKAASNDLSNLGNGCRFGFSDELNTDDRLDICKIKGSQGKQSYCDDCIKKMIKVSP